MTRAGGGALRRAASLWAQRGPGWPATRQRQGRPQMPILSLQELFGYFWVCEATYLAQRGWAQATGGVEPCTCEVSDWIFKSHHGDVRAWASLAASPACFTYYPLTVEVRQWRMQQSQPDIVINGLIRSSVSVSMRVSPAPPQQWLCTRGTRAVRHTQVHTVRPRVPGADEDTAADALSNLQTMFLELRFMCRWCPGCSCETFTP